jgi:hypothetical protein
VGSGTDAEMLTGPDAERAAVAQHMRDQR